MPLVTTNSLWIEFLWLVPLVAIWVILLRVFFSLWNLYITYRYLVSLKWVLLEVTVPQLSGVTPKSTEQMMAGLHGMMKPLTLVERYIQGFVPHRLSLELVGKNGEIHFYIRIQEIFKDLAKSHVFAQYPDAEINEVSDYSKEVPEDLPNEQWNLYGTELKLTKDKTRSGVPGYVYPIRTYSSFKEDILEEKMIDPLAAVLEVFNHLKKGEQIWLQILCESTHDPWRGESEKEVNALIGRKSEEKRDDILSRGEKLLQAAVWKPGELLGMTAPLVEVKKENELHSLMQHISPGERAIVEAIELKAGKLGFYSKLRLIYLGKRDIFSTARVSAFLGAWKQFATQDLNGFMPDKRFTTRINYFFKDTREAHRKRRILMRYRSRSFSGLDRYVLNIEEIASMYHFPMDYVKAPATPRVWAKKAAAPVNLPI